MGVYGLYLFIFLVTVWANNRRESPFSLLFFFVCVGCDTMKGQTTCATNTLKNPYLILWFFFKFKII